MNSKNARYLSKAQLLSKVLCVVALLALTRTSLAQLAPTLRIVGEDTPSQVAAPDLEVAPAPSTVFTVDVRVDNPLPQGVVGYSMGIIHDPAKLTILSVTQDVPAYSNLPVGSPIRLSELYSFNESDLGIAPLPGVGLFQIISLAEVFFLNPSSEGVLCSITYEVVSLAPGESTSIGFSEMVADPPSPPITIGIFMTGGAFFEDPAVTLENLTVTASFEGAFIRGSCAGSNGPPVLVDVIALLEYTFSGGSVTCADACDANDDGQVSFTDVFALLNVAFSGGGPLPGPNSLCGLDPTPDAVECAATPTNCP